MHKYCFLSLTNITSYSWLMNSFVFVLSHLVSFFTEICAIMNHYFLLFNFFFIIAQITVKTEKYTFYTF